MSPGFELMGWLKQAGAQGGLPPDIVVQPTPAAPQAGQAPGAAPVAAASARIVAPHSQAAAALAAALSAGGVPEKKQPQPHGSRISPMQEIVEVDRTRPESASALVVSKIANYPSEICRRHGHAIAVDANYICYGLKGGQIRILNRHTAARTLLKDHAAPVTDLRFFRHDSERCLLASVDTTGQVHVRKVYEEDADGEDTVRDEILARHELPIPTTGPGAHPPARLAWHPNYDFVLAVAAGPTVYLINVPPTADVAAAPEYSAPVAAARTADGAVMTSVAFSPAGDLLSAGDARGFVYVWALTPEQLEPALIQPLAAEPDIRFQAYGSAPGEAPYGDGTGDSAAVVSLNWMSRGGTGEGGGDAGEGSSNGGTPLVLLTGDGINAHLKLWTIDLSSKPQCTHAITLTSAAAPGGASAAFFNHLEAQPLYDCVVLANELRNHVYVLHVDLVSQPDAPTFDYVSEFSVKMPILSYTLAPEAFLDEATDAEAFKMYTIQSDAVQQYTLVPAQCFPMPGPTGPGSGAPGGGAAVSASGGFGHTLLPAGSGHGGGLSAVTGIADGAAAARASKDPLAALLALQQQQRQLHQQEKLREPAPVLPLTQPPSALLGMPSDVSDATSPLLPAGVESSPQVGPSSAAKAVNVADGADGSAQGEPARADAPPEVEVAVGVASEATTAAVVAEDIPAAVQAAGAVAEVPAGEAAAAVPARPSLLLTPSQLMQSAAAAAAAARSVASSSASAAGPALTSAALHELYGSGAVAQGDGETAASTAGTSRSHSIPTVSNVLTPSASEVNLAAAAEAAAAEVVAAAEGEAEEAAARADFEESRAAPAAAVVQALPLTAAALAAALPAQAQLPQPSPTSMPPPPSELLVRRVSQSKSGPMPPLTTEAAQRPASAPPLPASPSGSAGAFSASGSVPVAAEPDAAAAAVANGGDTVAAASAATPTSTSASASAAPLPPVASISMSGLHATQQQQEALGKLVELQEQLLEQVSAGHRELLKVVRAEAQRNAKAAADAAATRAAEAVARKAAEERRKESAEMQKALTGAINHLGKDLSQRVADAAAATTAAVKAAIGPAVRAAVAEALPAALSAGSTAAALERALGSQLSAALPRAVADGLGAAFTAQVVPPLERATSTMFGQIETALRTGLDTHLAPLGPLGSLGGQLRDAASQVQAAAKSLKSEAAAVQQQAAAAASRLAATAVSQAAPAAPVPAANASGGGAKSAGRGAAAAQQQQQPATAAPASSGSRSAAAEASAVAAAAAAAAAVVTKAAPVATRTLSAAPPAAVPTRVEPVRSESVPAPAAPAVSAAPKAAPVPPPASVDGATQELILGLIRRGDLDGALSRVLERQDLQLVLWACSEAGGAGVLAAEPCPLGQPTLLSLLTFLSYDLTSDVDLKLGWIEAILKRLDVREPGLAPHIRGVLDSVKAALAVIARGGTGATAAKAKLAVHQAIGLIAMLS